MISRRIFNLVEYVLPYGKVIVAIVAAVTLLWALSRFEIHLTTVMCNSRVNEAHSEFGQLQVTALLYQRLSWPYVFIRMMAPL